MTPRHEFARVRILPSFVLLKSSLQIFCKSHVEFLAIRCAFENIDVKKSRVAHEMSVTKARLRRPSVPRHQASFLVCKTLMLVPFMGVPTLKNRRHGQQHRVRSTHKTPIKKPRLAGLFYTLQLNCSSGVVQVITSVVGQPEVFSPSPR